MSGFGREVLFLIHQFLGEKKYTNAIRWLERDSGFYFDMKYFEDVVTNGEWDDVEKYLYVFTKDDDNVYSLEMFFEIKKQKYLEALDKPDYVKAVEILRKELTVFSTTHDEVLNKMTLLLRLPNFRENAELSKYGDTKQARSNLLGMLKNLIKKNPLFQDKLQFPNMENSRLLTLIEQSLNWQHNLCKNPKPHPGFETLFVDHSCGQRYGARALSGMTTQLTSSLPEFGGFPPLVTSGPGASPHEMFHTPGGPKGLSARNNADSEPVKKRARPLGSLDEVNNPVTCPGQTHPHTSYSSDELPKMLVATLSYNSSVKSMDFHPVQQTFLLVGTNTGDIVLWEVGNPMHASKEFKVYNLRACSESLQASLAKDPTASVNRVTWNYDGTLFGVAYSKNIVHLYSFHGGNSLGFHFHLQIEAHVGYVSDLAFSHPNKRYIITCGEDKAVKVWDGATGANLYNFVGHEAPVYSVCPRHRKHTQVIFSNSVDGKIKAWLYDDEGPRVNTDALGQSCTRMAYSADGTRLFSCGTNRDGESHIVEWDDDIHDVVKVKRSYVGLGKRAAGVVQFDTMNNRFLVAGDEFLIKFWDIENVNLLATGTTDAVCGLLASPCIRSSKEGVLLAVSVSDNSVIIIVNEKGSRLVETVRARSPDLSRMPEEMITNQSQLCCLRIPDTSSSAQITKLIYTNSGGAILALASNGIHKLWKWHKNEQNRDGKATVNVLPELWQPASGRLMTNDISDTKPEDAVPCLVPTKNDGFVISGSGGQISVFNNITFETMTTCMPPPSAATSLALNPQDNNILALGMQDSSIHIFNTEIHKVTGKLEGHQDRVTGLAFSIPLNALVSSGADGQICVWSMDGWKKQASEFVHIPYGRAPSPRMQNHVQFHQDQTHLLVSNENLIAIYEAPELTCIEKWFPGNISGSVTCATYSCDSQSVYAGFESGNIIVFSAALSPQCLISPKAYLTTSLSNPSTRVYPLDIAAHPNDPNQFAVGLSDGGVLVFEPLESERRWCTITISSSWNQKEDGVL